MLNIAVQRLYNQHLVDSTCATPAAAVAALGAVQGQDYPGAKWALALRVPGSTDAAIERALDEGGLLRTWALRGTLHLVAAADVHWLLHLVAPRLIASMARRYREVELDEPTLERSGRLLVAALPPGQRRDRRELLAMLEANGISTAGQRGYHMLMHAGLERRICQVGVVRNTPIFAALAPPAAPLPARDEALAELARRYFTSHGPATLADFVWWSGLAAGEARAALAALSAELRQETVGGQEYWLSADQPDHREVPGLLLLPGFDEFLVSYRDRSPSIAAEHERSWGHDNGVFTPTIVRAGQVVGLWKRTFKKDAVAISVEPLSPLSAADREAIAAAAEEFGRFLGMAVILP
ncbi:MAG TPA: winged helix DNA-binding domain-containing protein [Herpetosiphonaceae bacterium]|nr:winged helix DNA-binding domain-containing protein [Herpetosiphonaceae bacterium]